MKIKEREEARMSRNESLLKDVPFGVYCYTIREIVSDKIYGVIVKTNKCPYYMYTSDGYSKCLYMCIDSFEDCLLDDQVKICGINEEDNESEK
jgi:hypothetical protein